MSAFSDILYDVGTHFGHGLGAGALDEIKGREKERRTVSAWQRLTPFRREVEEEELGKARRKGQLKSELAIEQLYGGGAAEAYTQPGFGGTKGLEATRAAEDAEKIRRALEPALGPSIAIPPGTPTKGLELLTSLAKMEKREPRAPTPTEMQLRYSQGDPEATAFFEGPPGAPQKGYIDVQRQIAGMRTRGAEDVRGALPPDISPEERTRLGAHTAALGIVRDIKQMLLPTEQGGMGARQFLGKYRGSAAFAGARRLGSALGLAPGVPEETFRATVQSRLNDAIRASAGATQTPTEVARQLQEVPSPDDTDEQFTAKLQLSERNILRNKAMAERQLTLPRRRSLGTPGTKRVDRFGNIVEE